MTDKQLQQLTKKELIELYESVTTQSSIITLDEAIKIVKDNGLTVSKPVDYTIIRK